MTIDQQGIDPAARFQEIITARLGFAYDAGRSPAIDELLRRRLHDTQLPSAAYLSALTGSDDFASREIDVLVQELTVGETYFFRHREQFQAFLDVALPESLRARPNGVSILSVGCATGEEPYSLAILVREAFPDRVPPLSITALDLNPAALAKARAARYGSWSLRDTSPERLQRWFKPAGRDYVLDESVTSLVRFERANLADPRQPFLRPDQHDIVFCRNVLMYLTVGTIRSAVAGISRSLKRPGFLFLGSAETLRGVSQDFHLRHENGAFIYEVKPIGERTHAENRGVQVAVVSMPSGAPDPQEDGSWIDTIQRASRRIEDLAGNTTLDESRRDRARERVRVDLAPAVESIRSERYAEALEHLRGLPAQSAEDADVLLLRAVVLTQSGDTAAAESVGTALLKQDDLNAGAHYVLALCREAAGDHGRAVEHDRMASYLDPGFAMPRLHLGLMSLRRRDRQQARIHLQDALILLQREDSARLLLFGGGFDREALMDICRAELAANREHA